MTCFKKLTAVLMAVLMLASLAVTGVYADENADLSSQLTVNASSNIGSAVSEVYNTQTDSTVKVRYTMTAVPVFANIQGYVTYDKNVLEIQDIALSDAFPAPVYNKDLNGTATFNSTTDDNIIDFTEGGTFLTVTFKILSAGETNVALKIEELSALSQEWKLYGIISDGVIVRQGDISGSAEFGDIPEVIATAVELSAAKSKIYVGGTTTVKASVNNPSGNTVYESDNKKVAVVDQKGKVKGVSAGTAYIIATNNGMSDSVKIKVVKRANTLKVTPKKLIVKAKSKKTAFTKTKAFKISKAKGKLTFKKTKGDKRITINKKTGKITVRKGLKKSRTYKVKIKVTAAGDKTYNKGSKTVAVSIKVK